MAESIYLGKVVIGAAHYGSTNVFNNKTGYPASDKPIKIQRENFYLNQHFSCAHPHVLNNRDTC